MAKPMAHKIELPLEAVGLEKLQKDLEIAQMTAKELSRLAGKIAEDVYELKIAIKQPPGATGDCED